MAKLKGVLKLEGTIDDLTFYRTRDGLVVRRKSSLTAARIKTDPKFGNFRKSGTEFGHCSTIGSQIRKSIAPLLKGLSGRDMINRLVQCLGQIKDLDKRSRKGKRKLINGMKKLEGRAIWQQFSFIKYTEVSHEIRNNILIDAAAGTITIRSWSSESFQTPSEAATHIQLQFAWLDYNFDGEASPALFQSTSIQPLHTTIPSETLTFALPKTTTGMITLFVATQFYQEINGVYLPLHNQLGRMVAVVKVVVSK
jgi:hypothetical protein